MDDIKLGESLRHFLWGPLRSSLGNSSYNNLSSLRFLWRPLRISLWLSLKGSLMDFLRGLNE